MTSPEWVFVIGWTLVAAPFIVVLSYVIVRVASVAHFRTRLEYLRSMLKELRRNEQTKGE